MHSKTTPLEIPHAPSTGFCVSSGLPTSKISKLREMSDKDWEQFIHEWASVALKAIYGYSDVHNCGGAGDMGRDVVAYYDSLTGPYDNYQCKHYDHPLHPGDIWSELGKLCYWTYKKEFEIPVRYVFVAPYGVGTTLLKYLEKPNLLKTKLLEVWNKECMKKITSTVQIPLSKGLNDHIEKIDFSIFSAASPTKIIDEHSKTHFHILRFGGGLPPRIEDTKPPETIAEYESRYVRQLLDAYGEHASCALSCADDLSSIHEKYTQHLKTSREEFYSAECLNKFSRDYLPPNCFGALQEDIEDGVREVVNDDYEKGLDRIKATVKAAKNLPIEGHPLRDCIRPRDKGGICHQLANSERFIWLPQS